MRIIRGKYQRRQIHAPANLPVRPTTDMAKESLFNILENQLDFPDIDALDLFSGTGNIAFELASRGCQSVLAIDQNKACVQFIKDTIKQLEMDNLHVIRMDVFKFLPGTPQQFDLIFADPPYDSNHYELLAELILESNLLKPDGILVIEHSANIDYSTKPCFSALRNYGRVHFSFFNKP
ncbi:MAG: 16S rRNA (guanine(966)-N(2))-methyltransferase RsmD [Bacteroidetes bacterium]|nr:16S rRNA (guanine(966)-N(2))-methyltransferase RsmD [Bacteroidota bacterium]MBU1578093.1 16S rRNA (guanine(966)-N(2))-methyltransferase RsmD [Bacteroidota bacterium]MBU2466614.1 16S rRNA (guanine(966)-N(2))-methyltransferase RsmD [Bacteroidota bacterium]MBU2558225.1 16S rRNA (guanine(966)-N(2))-methyltransferase RsmD [Bacteroidota bacterium]